MQEELRRLKPELLALLLEIAKSETSKLEREESELDEPEREESSEEIVAPLTFAQQRLWLIDRFAPGTLAYNIPQSWTVNGALDLGAVREAVQLLAQRHGALRTRIELRHGEPVQVVADFVEIPLDFTDLSGVAPEIDDEADRQTRLTTLLVEEGRRPFVLGREPLIRFHLVRLAEDRHVISYNVHHIVADQWSLGILKRDLIAFYLQAVTGRAADLPALTTQYSDIAEQERSEAADRLHVAQIEYWRERLRGMPTLLELPFAKIQPATPTFQGETFSLTLNPKLTTQLRQLAVRGNTSLYLLMLTVFAALLYRYTGERDMCIGSPITGRKRREDEDVVGLFLNMLPLRCSIDPRESFNALLRRNGGAVLADFEHSDVPFQRLVVELHPERSPSQSPFFQIMFALNPKGKDAPDEQHETFIGTSKFDLSLQIAELADTLDAHFEYRSDLFDRAGVERFSRHFVHLASSIVDEPERAVGSLSLLTEEDLKSFRQWNATGLSFDREQKLTSLFEQQVASTPDALALRFGESALTYRELNDRATRLADFVSRHGAGPGSYVAICLNRSVELIVAILAVLKAGAAYLPLDPNYPETRLNFMLKDSGARLMIARRDDLSERLARDNPGVAVIDPDAGGPSSGANPEPAKSFEAAAPSDAAYLIYTSGSTGTPKGVVVEHRNAVALLAWAKSYFDFESLRGVLASTSVCFDLSIFEIFLPLSSGTTVIMVNDLLELPKYPHAQNVTLINTVPSAMKALLHSGLPSSVRTVCMAGELLPQELVDRVYAAGVHQVFDLYGPTETTTYSTFALRKPGGLTSIGKPIGNTRIYLLDENLAQVPVGALGEIFIGGEGVTRGYLGRQELTDERFIEHPAIEQRGRLYRTGDLARQLDDGTLVYLGRRDGQVKLRGHRIELGEIEAALRAASGSADVAVAVAKRESGDALVAFVAVNDAVQIGVMDYAAALRRVLPAYMIPARILPIAALPLTPNGKIDRKALGLLASTDAAGDPSHKLEPPRDLLEQWLANIWASRMGLKTVARDAHFFDDLGGHSLLAFEIFNEIEQRLGTAMPLAILFQAPTVELLAIKIRSHGWKEPKCISFLVAGSSDKVIYLLDTDDRSAIPSSLCERVMTTALHALDDTQATIEDVALAISSFEAARPRLILSAANSGQESARKLASLLSRAGFIDLSMRLL
jgi:amino acid adenylation domain-containing protein